MDNLSALEIFSKISPASLALVTRTMTQRSYKAGVTVLFQDDWGQAVYFILEGWVKIRLFQRDGTEITLNILGAEEIVGEMAALDQSPRSTDVIALTALRLGILPRDTFLTLVSREPLFNQDLLILMANRLRQANRRLMFRDASSEKRLIDILLFIAEGQGRTSREGVMIPAFPHRELAALSGLARETVSRSLAELQRQGLVEKVDMMLRLPSLDRLRDMLGD